MKNTIFIFLFTIMAAATSYAQFGIKAGVNASRISTNNDDIEGLKGKYGYQAGVMVKINISEDWAIQPEAMFTRKGARYDILRPTGASVKTEMDYIDFPVVLMYTPLNLPVSFHLGPQFSYLVQTNVTYESLLLENVFYKSEKDNFEDYDFGFVAGVGFHLEKFLLEFRYTRGLKKYEKDATIDNIKVEPSSRHYGLQASLGYYF